MARACRAPATEAAGADAGDKKRRNRQRAIHATSHVLRCFLDCVAGRAQMTPISVSLNLRFQNSRPNSERAAE